MADDSKTESKPPSSDVNAAQDDARAHKRKLVRRQFVVGVSGVVAGAAACDDGADTTFGGSGGDAATSGGSQSSGGALPTTTGGVQTASGGSAPMSGGRAAAAATGGARATGGTPNGGANASGGAPVVSGGAPAAGGSAGTSGANSAGTSGANSAGTSGAGAVGRKAASDQVILGSTGIRVSRLAMGGGSSGSNGTSAQARLGVNGFADLMTHGYDQQGITFFETADAYGTHEHVAEAIRRVGRENVVVLTKTLSEDADGVEEDLARFREELGIDTIDIVLLHLKTSRNWTTQCEGAMSALARAKQGGAIRAHGVSCHSIDALRLAAKEPWVDVDLARINPAGVQMDDDPDTVIQVLREMKTAGKGIIGMKILGDGRLVNRLDEAIKHAVDLDTIDAFTIGFTSQAQLDQVVGKISSVQG